MNCFEIIPEITVSGGKAIVDGKEMNCADLAYDLYCQGADGILLNNVDKTMPGIAGMFRTVSEVSGRVFLPLRVSGAIYETAQIRIYINDGADRIYYNSNGIRFPHYVNDSVKKLGSHYVGVTVNCRRDPDIDVYQAYLSDGKVSAGKDASLWLTEALERGAYDVMVNVMSDTPFNKDDINGFMGKLNNFNRSLLLRGGFDSPEQFVFAHSVGAFGVVSNAIGQGKLTVEQVKEQLAKQNINVR